MLAFGAGRREPSFAPCRWAAGFAAGVPSGRQCRRGSGRVVLASISSLISSLMSSL